MPTINIVDTAFTPLSYQPPSPQSFSYGFTRGSYRWLCLWGFAEDVDADEVLAMYRSSDGGTLWERLGDSTTPNTSKVIGNPVTYDSAFDYVAPNAQTTISALYDSPDDSIVGSDRTSHYHIADFTFDSTAWGTPYADLDVVNVAISPLFSSLATGGFIAVYTRYTTSSYSASLGTYYRIWNGSTWSTETQLQSGGSQVRHLVCDQDGNTHVIIDGRVYFRISSLGAIVEGPTSIYSSGTAENLIIVGDALMLSISESTQATILTGTPLSGPSWTQDQITSIDMAINQNTAWLANLSSRYNIDANPSGTDDATMDDFDYTIDFTPDVDASGICLHWISSDFQTIYRSVFSAGAWGGAETIWSAAPPTVSNIFSLVARSPAAAPGAGAARYRPFW